MGSDLYRARVVEKTDCTVSVQIASIHPDAPAIPEDPSFALMLLWEAIAEAPEGAALLSEEVCYDDTVDKAWVRKFAKGFIREVRISDAKASRSKRPTANLAITVSHPDWIAHLSKGLVFDIRSFQLVSRYDSCAPILPEAGKALRPKVTSSSAAASFGLEGFLAVPRECFARYSIPKETPAILWMPAFSSAAYDVIQTMNKGAIDQGRLASWLGRAVVVKAKHFGLKHGALAGASVDQGISLLLLSPSSCGMTGFGNDVESIGLMVLKKGGRRGEQMGYSRVIAEASVMASLASKTGPVLELRLRLLDPVCPLSIESESDVLRLIAAPLLVEDDRGDPCFNKALAKSPLARSLKQELTQRGFDGPENLKEVFPEVALNYIASFEIVRAAKSKPRNFDRLSFEEVRAALESEWPTATLRVTVTDPKWGEHLSAKTFSAVFVEQYPLPAPTVAAPADEATAPAIDAASANAPERMVLLFDSDTSKKIWMAERTGASWMARWGKQGNLGDGQSKAYQLGDEQSARDAMDKTVKKKLKEGYRAAPSREKADEITWTRLGLRFDDSSGSLIVQQVADRSTSFVEGGLTWFRPDDIVRGINNDSFKVCLVEEIAAYLEQHPPGVKVFLSVARRTTKSIHSCGIYLRV